MLKFTEKVKLKNSSKLVMLYQGREDSTGRDFFVYFLSDEKQIMMMRDDFQNAQSRVIGEYGEMLYSAYQAEPDELATAFLERWVEETGGSLM
jgi:hypothetical protein